MNMSKQVAFFGDWNDPPSAKGRYSTQWLARQVGGHIVAPPKGKHGRIDHGVTTANNGAVIRIPGGESDHGMVLVDLYNPNASFAESAILKVRLATWNVERDRTAQETTAMFEFLDRVIYSHNVDVFCFQEVRDYHVEMKAWFEARGWAWIQGDVTEKMNQHNAIAVKGGVRHGPGWTRQLSTLGYKTKDGKPHVPSASPFVQVKGWLLVCSVHMVVSVDVKPGKVLGPTVRALIWRQSMKRLAEVGVAVRERREKVHG